MPPKSSLEVVIDDYDPDSEYTAIQQFQAIVAERISELGDGSDILELVGESSGECLTKKLSDNPEEVLKIYHIIDGTYKVELEKWDGDERYVIRVATDEDGLVNYSGSALALGFVKEPISQARKLISQDSLPDIDSLREALDPLTAFLTSKPEEVFKKTYHRILDSVNKLIKDLTQTLRGKAQQASADYRRELADSISGLTGASTAAVHYLVGLGS